MIEAGSRCLADSNIMLRLTKRDHAEYSLVRQAVSSLRQDGVILAYALQNVAEFWNVSTRPKERNGFGLTLEETDGNAREIERAFLFLPDVRTVYSEWRRLVMQHRIVGVQVHDARLAAAMYAHDIRHILTFNVSDFSRFSELRRFIRTASKRVCRFIRRLSAGRGLRVP